MMKILAAGLTAVLASGVILSSCTNTVSTGSSGKSDGRGCTASMNAKLMQGNPLTASDEKDLYANGCTRTQVSQIKAQLATTGSDDKGTLYGQ